MTLYHVTKFAGRVFDTVAPVLAGMWLAKAAPVPRLVVRLYFLWLRLSRIREDVTYCRHRETIRGKGVSRGNEG